MEKPTKHTLLDIQIRVWLRLEEVKLLNQTCFNIATDKRLDCGENFQIQLKGI